MVSLVETAASVTKGGIVGYIQSIATKLLLGALVVVCAAAGVLYWQNSNMTTTISTQGAALTKSALELDQSKLQVSGLQAEAVKNQAEILMLNSQLLVLQTNYKVAADQLEKYREKESEEAARQKPKLVQRRVNTATDRVFNDLECATGNCKTE